MFFTKTRALALSLLLVILAAGLSACGSNISGQTGSPPAPTASGNLPDSVQIEIQRVDQAQRAAPNLTLRVQEQVHQFYNTLYALPLLPHDEGCTADLGPQYTLTFFYGTRRLVTAVAQHYGCQQVTLSGETQARRASQTFWSQLDQAIYVASPPAVVQTLAIQHTLPGNQPVQTARITSATSAQNFYNTLIAQPQVQAGACNDDSYPVYQMVFQTKDQRIPAIFSQKCQSVQLNGNFDTRTASFRLTAQLQQLFNQLLASATFASAQPDTLQQTFTGAETTRSGLVTDAQLMRQLYAKIFTLQSTTVGPDCPSGEDKLKNTARWYSLDFTQWGLPVMNLTAYEGTVCKLVQPSPGVDSGATLSGDATFWDLVHRAAHA